MADRNFPAMYWNPETSEPRVFDAPEDVPAGWLPHHPANAPAAPPPAKPAPKASVPMTRAEIVAALDAGNVPYTSTTSDARLYKLLVSSLQTHLTEQGIKYPANADAFALLALVPPTTE